MLILILYFLWDVEPVGRRHGPAPEPAHLPDEVRLLPGTKCSWRMHAPIGHLSHMP